MLRLFTVAGGLYVIISAHDVSEEITHIYAVVHYEYGAFQFLLLLLQLVHLVLEGLRVGHLRSRVLFLRDEVHFVAEMLFACMEQHGKGGTFAYFALHLYMAVVQIDELFGEVESDTGACDAGVVQLVVAREALKEHTPFLRRDTDTLVLNGERHEAGLGVHDDADSFACRCELEGIAQQVP